MEPAFQRPPRARFIAMLAFSVVAIGVLFYHHVENWSMVDSLYFSVITLATVGYGDLVPTTDAGKIFTVFYVAIGIGIFAASANYLIKRATIRRMQKQDNKEKAKR
jgi:voltage-gated potassium channel Kch